MNDIRAAQDRFLSRRFGVFNHFLYGNPGDSVEQLRGRKALDWNGCVEVLDAEDIARRLHEVGAGYYFITVMQGSRHMLAPNAAYDRIAGTQSGEACPRRDLIMDLADALEKYDIDLYLYYTGDGPHLDGVIGPRFGFTEPRTQVTMEFVQKWAAVLREYAVRYGKKVKGWWIDGCYRETLGYDDRLMAPYYEACKAGNPDCLVAMNDGVKPDFEKNFVNEEFVCGEFNDFTAIPRERFIDGAQAHILAPLGSGSGENEWTRWRSRGARLSGGYMLDYVRRANAAGMPVTIDAFIDHNGAWDPDQYDVLKAIGDGLYCV